MNCKREINQADMAKMNYFNSMASKWDETVGNNDERKNLLKEILVSKTAIKEGDRILDIGCGTGILIPLIKGITGDGGSVTAVDPCEEMLQVAESKNSHITGVEYICSAIEDMEGYFSSFDVVTAFAVFPHIEDKKTALTKIREMLKQDGRLYIFHLAKTDRLNSFHSTLDAPVKHDHMPEREEMEQLFAETGFSMIEYIDRDDLNFIKAKPCR